jgi:signal transduction histidine kinase
VEGWATVSTLDDERRAEVVAAYEVLERPDRRDLQALAELAALVCDVPMAAIDLVTSTGQHRVAAAGETGEARFTGAHPLCTPEGIEVGALRVFDDRPRELTPEQVRALETLAERAVDVLELGLATRRLLAAQERVAASDERLAAFAGQLSHDLKNPLTGVTMSLEMARDEAADLDDADLLVSLIDRAGRGAERMQRMIDDLLAFARGGSAPEVTDVDLAALVDEVLEDLGPALGTATVEASGLPTVPGDPAQLRVVVHNLLTNALKFAREGVEPRIAVTAGQVDGHWRVEVTDNGRGVPEDRRERVFEPFVRLDKSVPGTGVGLATCRRVVEAHGGTIGLRGAPGGGTTVWFQLPAGSGPVGSVAV